MEAGLAAKGRDSQSTGSRFSGSLLDFRDEMRWDGVHACCPSLTPWPRRRQANRAVTELPPGHAEYMIKM